MAGLVSNNSWISSVDSDSNKCLVTLQPHFCSPKKCEGMQTGIDITLACTLALNVAVSDSQADIQNMWPSAILQLVYLADV